jgi:hypothetical protein
VVDRYGDGTGNVGKRRSLQGEQGEEKENEQEGEAASDSKNVGEAFNLKEGEEVAKGLRLPAEAAAAAKAERKALEEAMDSARRERGEQMDLTTGRDIEPLSEEEIGEKKGPREALGLISQGLGIQVLSFLAVIVVGVSARKGSLTMGTDDEPLNAEGRGEGAGEGAGRRTSYQGLGLVIAVLLLLCGYEYAVLDLGLPACTCCCA